MNIDQLHLASPRVRERLRWVLVAIAYFTMIVFWEAVVARRFHELSLPVLGRAFVGYIANPELWSSLSASLRRVFVGYLIATATAVSAGLVFGLLPMLEELFDPFIAMIRPISPLAWLPLATIWFGVSESAAMFLIGYAAAFPIFINTIRGVRSIPKSYPEAAMTMGARPRTIVRRVLLPAALPSILTGLRLGMGLAWSAIVAAELAIGFVLQRGIGYLMFNYAMFTFDLGRLVLLTFMIGAIGATIDIVLRMSLDRAMRWRRGVTVVTS